MKPIFDWLESQLVQDIQNTFRPFFDSPVFIKMLLKVLLYYNQTYLYSENNIYNNNIKILSKLISKKNIISQIRINTRFKINMFQ